MFQKRTLSIALVWLLVAASIMMCMDAGADSSARPQNADPRFPSLAGKIFSLIKLTGIKVLQS